MEETRETREREERDQTEATNVGSLPPGPLKRPESAPPNLAEVMRLESENILQTYARYPVLFVRGQGNTL